MDHRQAAAITRKKRQARFDRDAAEERRRLGLVLPPEPSMEPVADPDLVGWAYFGRLAGGEGHQCINCSPTKPGLVFQPVQRFRLAARRTCGTCGVVLETVVRQQVTDEEKK